MTRGCRVSVLGNSVALIVEPPRAHRGEGTYAEHLAALLEESGLRPDVRNHARWYELLTAALCDYEAHVRAASPDVLILQYGINECVPRVLPMAVHRHLFTWHEHAWRGHRRYKRALRSRVWPVLRRYQRAAAVLLGGRTHRVRPGRYAAELRYLIDLARRDTACLVLVLDVLPPGPSVEHWIPGIGRRRERLNDVMRRVVSDVADASVRFVDTSALVAPLGAGGVPDGVHLSAAGHRAVAEHLAAEIVEWLPTSRSGTR